MGVSEDSLSLRYPGTHSILRNLSDSLGFRPPAQRNLAPNDLEIYNIRTDAWGLLTIALMLVVVSGAVPIPGISNGKSRAQHENGLQPYAKAAILADVFHHIMTGIGAWNHYAKDTHYNTSMGVGVWGCSGLALLGLLTLVAPPKISGLNTNGTNRVKTN